MPDRTGSFRPDDPAKTWIQALKDDHAQAERSVAQELNRIAFDGSVPDSTWDILLDNGIIWALFEILGDNRVCGFTQHELDHLDSDPDDPSIMEYCVDILSLLSLCLRHIALLCDHTKHASSSYDRLPCSKCTAGRNYLEPLRTEYAPVLQTLWEIRNPLLVKQCGWYSSKYRLDTYYDRTITLGGALLQCHSGLWDAVHGISDSTFTEQFKKPIYRSCHILLLIWLNHDAPAVRQDALHCLIPALDTVFPDVIFGPYTEFFNEVTNENGGLERGDIYSAILYDLQAWDLVTSCELNSYYDLVRFVTQFRAERYISPRSRHERPLLWHSLSAARRQLCSMESDCSAECKPAHDEECLVGLAIYLSNCLGKIPHRPNTKPVIPELWVYAMIPMFALHLSYLATRDDRESLDDTQHLVLPCVREFSRCLRFYRSHPPSGSRSQHSWQGPPSPTVRRYTLDIWKKTKIDLLRLRLPLNPTLKTLYSVWSRLGQELEQSLATCGEDPTQRDFGPLKRCAWSECACSAFQPIHKMKKCKRCHLVAYCNPRCQWEDRQAHRNVCR